MRIDFFRPTYSIHRFCSKPWFRHRGFVHLQAIGVIINIFYSIYSRYFVHWVNKQGGKDYFMLYSKIFI